MKVFTFARGRRNPVRSSRQSTSAARRAGPAPAPVERLESRRLLAGDGVGDSLVGAIDLVTANAPIAPGTTVAPQMATVNRSTDTNDIFRFDLNGNSRVTIGLNGLEADWDLYLLNFEGRVIGSSRTSSVNPESITATLADDPAHPFYFIQVNAFGSGGGTSAAGNVTFSSQAATGTVTYDATGGDPTELDLALPENMPTVGTPGTPVAVADAAQTAAGTAAMIDVLANDTDAGGDPSMLTVTVVVQPTNGTAVEDAVTRRVVYTPNAGFNGTDTFTYTVTDAGNLTSTPATVTVTVGTPTPTPTPVPTPTPTGTLTANDDTANAAVPPTGTRPTPVPINVLTNDTDVPDRRRLTVTTKPTLGTARVNAATGVITYTPRAGGSAGTDTFVYTIRDRTRGSTATDTATVTITLTGSPPPIEPVARADAATAVVPVAGQPVTPVTITVLANDSGTDGNIPALPADVTVALAGRPTAGGRARLNRSTGMITYTPRRGATAGSADTFTYTLKRKGRGTTATAAQTVTVTLTAAANAAPVAVNDTATAAQGAPVAINVLANDTDANGNNTLAPATVTVLGSPAPGGTATVNTTTGVVTFTPQAGFTGTDTFRYTVRDSAGADSAPATVTVTVTAGAAPTADTDAATTAQGVPVEIDVLTGDTDSDGTLVPASVTVVTAPAAGNTTAVNPTTGAITYTPAAGFTGTDTFTYTVTDDDGLISAPATVTVTVTPTATLAVTSLDLLDTAGDTVIRALQTATDSITASPARSIRANTTGTAGSVVFEFQGQPDETEGTAPYTLGGDQTAGADFLAYAPLNTPGTYLVTARVFSGANGTGTEGTALMLTLTVT